MKKTGLIFTSLTALAIVVSTAFAASPATQTSDSSRWIEQRVMKRIVSRVEGRLNMTASQREQAKVILQGEQPTIVALAAQGRLERDELLQMQTFDDVRVRAMAQRYASTNTDVLVERAKVRMKLRAVLNDTQRQQLDTMRAKIGAHFEERLGDFIDAI
jgi:Spy/CpxP family protein refolding chaperone